MTVKTRESKSLKRDEKIKQSKKVKISSKRQISIPKEFYDAIGLEEEVLIERYNNRLVIRPIRSESEDFSEEILSDLIDEGYQGEELKRMFTKRRALISPAVDNLIEDARTSKAYDSFEDMLKDTEDESDDE